MLKGSKLLKIAGILELIIGVGTLIITWFIVGSADMSSVVNDDIAANVLLLIVVVYGIHIFEALAGLIGIIKANKKSVLTFVLGVILFFGNLVEFFTHDQDTIQIVIHAVTLIVPYLYLHGAFMNWKG